MSVAGSADIVTAAGPGGCEAPPPHAVGSDAPPAHVVEEMDFDVDNHPVGRFILNHADKVCELGQYLGVMDLMAYGWAKKTRIVVLIADGSWDLFEVFAPDEINMICRGWPDVLHVIGCNVESVAHHWKNVNHWIYCLPMGDVGPSVSKKTPGFARFSSAKECFRSVLGKYSELGYCVFPTVTDGNCGPDCMSQSAGFLTIRDFSILAL